MAGELLLNGLLAGPFSPYREDTRLIVAAGWAPWWHSPSEGDPEWKNRTPTYGGFTLDGRQTQQVSTPWGTHEAGLWQQVPSAAGNQYELIVEAQGWSSEDTVPGSQLEASDINVQIGLDPTGGLDPDSPLLHWSEAIQPLGQWQTLHLTATAEAPIITVFLRSAPNLPKRQQAIFWRNARLRPVGRHKRSVNIVGAGDTHIRIEPERPASGEPVQVVISSTREHRYTELIARRSDDRTIATAFLGKTLDDDRHIWRHRFVPDTDGLFEIRFSADAGSRLLALRLLRVARDVQLVPAGSARTEYRRVYVLLPPSATKQWFTAAARGSYAGRYTIGFSADDAGMGEFEQRHVLAVNPHHWPEVLTKSWFEQHYPGARYTAVVANSPDDLSDWLEKWDAELDST